MAFPGGWRRRGKITVPAAQVTGSHNDFPLLLTQDNFPAEMLDGGVNSALDGGADLRFSADSAGSEPLACEVVRCVTGGAPLGEVWVKLPLISADAATEFYVWYGNAGATQLAVTDPYGAQAVWAGYDYVSHDGGLSDSALGHSILVDAAGISEDGPWGGSARRGTYARLVDPSVGDYLTDFTLQVWHKGNGNGTLLSRRDGGTYQWQLYLDNNTYGAITTGASGGTALTSVPQGWNHACLVLHTPSDMDFYLNGGASVTGINLTSITSQALPTRIAYRGAGGIGTIGYANANGVVGDVRFRTGTLSGDWLATEYLNQSDPATFVIVSPAEAGPAGLVTASGAHGLMSESPSLDQRYVLAVMSGRLGLTSAVVGLLQRHALTLASGRSLLTGFLPVLALLSAFMPKASHINRVAENPRKTVAFSARNCSDITK